MKEECERGRFERGDESGEMREGGEDGEMRTGEIRAEG